MTWHDEAVCVGTDPEGWFTDRRGNSYANEMTLWRLQALCLRCPVIAECAADALRTGALYGLRAGVRMPTDGTLSRAGLRPPLEAVARGDIPDRLPQPKKPPPKPPASTTTTTPAVPRAPRPRTHSKLTDEQVVAMRAYRAAGSTCASLSRFFGVSTTLVSAVCRGERWAHVGGWLTGQAAS